MRKRPGLSARGPVGPAGRVDRADQPTGRRQDLLLRAAGTPKRDQGAAALSASGYGARDPVDPAGRAAQRARLPAHVPHEEDQSQAAKRADTLQRLSVQAYVRVRVHRPAGRRRSDYAREGRDLAGADEPGVAQGPTNTERDPRLVQRQKRLLPRRPTALSRLLQGHTQVSKISTFTPCKSTVREGNAKVARNYVACQYHEFVLATN